ncbi:MAG TPA: hypothetical protein VG347_03895, partial [Verrucomicrobiae bacterium]|nr:hypothetical protein [Verrucomicrobiae bacterium]
MTKGLFRARRRAIASEMKAERIGADTKFTMRQAGCDIQVRFKSSSDNHANPQPTINQVKHVP